MTQGHHGVGLLLCESSSTKNLLGPQGNPAPGFLPHLHFHVKFSPFLLNSTNIQKKPFFNEALLLDLLRAQTFCLVLRQMSGKLQRFISHTVFDYI